MRPASGAAECRARRAGADGLPHDEMLRVIGPYFGELAGVRGDWTPLDHRETLFDEQLDRSDPWQFVNFRVD